MADDYVSPGGDDANDGTRPEAPLRRVPESKDTEATEAAYAQEALSTIRWRARSAPPA